MGPGYKRVLVDVVSDVHRLRELPDSPETVQMDLNDLARKEPTDGVRSLEKAIDAVSGGQGTVDTMVASALVNYVDKDALKRLHKYLSPGGTMFINYSPTLGDPEMMHRRRFRSDGQLTLPFIRMGYTVEERMEEKDFHEERIMKAAGMKMRGRPMRTFTLKKPETQ